MESPARPLDFRDYDPMARRQLNRQQLEEHLARQTKFLRKRAAEFDAGDEDECLSMATVLRLLLHHTADKPRGTSHALLEQLGLRCKWQYLDSSRPATPPEMDGTTLVVSMRIVSDAHGNPSTVGQPGGLTVPGSFNGRPAWVAPLGTAPAREVDFDTWWDVACIDTSSGATYSRHQLVLIMSNQAGGAHVDPGVDADFEDFTLDDLGVKVSAEPGDWTMTDPPGGWLSTASNIAAHSIRQVAYELLETMDRSAR